MKTKFTKVSVEERLPEEIDTNTVFFTKKGNVRIFYNEKYIKDYEPNYEEEELEYFLEESPDREDEMREMLERMKINLLFTSEIGFGNRLTSDELERYTKEIDELLDELIKDRKVKKQVLFGEMKTVTILKSLPFLKLF